MFEVVHQDTVSCARLGRLTTAHQVVDTPAFMPVATKATVKTLTPTELRDMGTQAIISNAFHLYIGPGHELIQKAGWTAQVHGVGRCHLHRQRWIPDIA